MAGLGSKPTQAAPHPDTILTYNTSDMVLSFHSNASYLSAPRARSHAGEHWILSNNSEDPPNNAIILINARTLKHVISSAVDAEIGTLFAISRKAIPVRTMLMEIGHQHTPYSSPHVQHYRAGICNHKSTANINTIL